MTWDIEVAARTLCQECRGEPLAGQDAVAWVIKNRLATGRWGKSLASVCLWPMQFSGWRGPQDPNFRYACELPDEDATLSHMRSVMQAAMENTTDPTGGATFYFANSMPTPPVWAATMVFCGEFGHQRFFKPQPVQSASEIA